MNRIRDSKKIFFSPFIYVEISIKLSMYSIYLYIFNNVNVIIAAACAIHCRADQRLVRRQLDRLY